MVMVLGPRVLLPLLPALAPPLDLGVVVRVGAATLAVKVVDKHLKQSLKRCWKSRQPSPPRPPPQTRSLGSQGPPASSLLEILSKASSSDAGGRQGS